jgi:hypothetical protein
MKRNAPELGTEGFVTPFLPDFILLIVQLVVLGKDLGSGSASARTNNLDKF